MPLGNKSKSHQTQKVTGQKRVSIDFTRVDASQFAKLAATFQKEQQLCETEALEGDLDPDAEADLDEDNKNESNQGPEYDGDANIVDADEDEFGDTADKSCETSSNRINQELTPFSGTSFSFLIFRRSIT
jgi:hypothetical protein